jgi:hypothetical protein
MDDIRITEDGSGTAVLGVHVKLSAYTLLPATEGGPEPKMTYAIPGSVTVKVCIVTSLAAVNKVVLPRSTLLEL